MSGTIGFLGKPNLDDWSKIEILNDDLTELTFNSNELKFHPDYDIFNSIPVIGQTEDYYIIDFINYGHKKFKKSNTDLTFMTWEQYITQVVVAVGFNPDSNPIKSQPDTDSKTIPYVHDSFYHPIKIQGDWLFINRFEDECGWIKWRDKDLLLIDLFYLL